MFGVDITRSNVRCSNTIFVWPSANTRHLNINQFLLITKLYISANPIHSANPTKMLKPKSVRDVVTSYMETSTVVGVNRILISPLRTQRTVWTVIVLAGTMGTAYHAYTMVDRFFNYPSRQPLAKNVLFEISQFYKL